MKLIVLTLALCGAASGALAQASLFDGFWGSADAPECLSADGSFSTCEALTIGQGQFQGQESVCDMTLTGAVPGMSNAQVYDMNCRGEGDTWAFRAILHRSPDSRLTVLDDYGTSVYLPLAISLSGAAPAPTK